MPPERVLTSFMWLCAYFGLIVTSSIVGNSDQQKSRLQYKATETSTEHASTGLRCSKASVYCEASDRAFDLDLRTHWVCDVNIFGSLRLSELATDPISHVHLRTRLCDGKEKDFCLKAKTRASRLTGPPCA